ncbi:MAG TPA: TIR domain-containing protein [Verrucomicrobiae bacterium]|jgi:WD40 repeat protein
MNEARQSDDSSSYRYWAFISYSSKDKAWAKWLHRSIKTYGIPTQFIDHPTPAGVPAPKRFHPLFRDRDELPASPDLGRQIQDALRTSRYLIVICSPNAASSEWVNKEILEFQSLGRHSHVLALIVDGEPNAGDEHECFPKALRSAGSEPKAADARREGGGKNDAKLALLAGMLGVNLDSLKQRDASRQIRRLRMTVMISTMLVACFAAVAYAAVKARRTTEIELKIAVAKQLAAEGFAEADGHLDLALLLCAHAEQLDSSVDARSGLLHALQKIDSPFRFLWGHQSEVNDVVFSPVGHAAAGASYDGALMLWNTDKPEEPSETILTKRDQFSCVAFNHDGTMLAAGGGEGGGLIEPGPDYGVYVYDLQHHKSLFGPMEGHTNQVVSVAFSPDGRKLASAADAGDIILWNLATGKSERRFGLTNADDSCRLYFSQASQLLIVHPHGIAIYDLGQHRIIAEKPSPVGGDEIERSAFCQTNGILAVMSRTKVVLLDAERFTTNEEVHLEALAGDNSFTALGLNYDASLIAIARGNSLAVWDLNQHSWRGPSQKILGGDIHGLAFHPAKNLLLWTGTDAKVVLCDLDGENALRKEVHEFDSDVMRCRFVHDGHALAACAGHKIILFDPDKHEIIGEPWESDDFDGCAFAWSPDGRSVAAGIVGNKIQLFATASNSPIELLEQASGDRVFGLDFSPDSQMLVACSTNHEAILWDLKQQPPAATQILHHSGPVFDVAFSPDGRWVASASGDHTVGFYDMHAKHAEPPLPPKHHGSIMRIAFSPDGELLASTSDDASVGIWSLNPAPKFLRRLTGHYRFASAVSFSADGSMLASGGGDGAIRLWKTGSWAPYSEALHGHAGVVWCVAFAPDGKQLVSGGADGFLTFWDLDPAHWIALARKMANRDLTSEEVNEYFGNYPYKPLQAP